MSKSKICISCNLAKPEDDFHKNGKNGRRADCKQCRKVRRTQSDARRLVDVNDVKTCNICDTEKNIKTEFFENGNDGYRPECIVCTKALKEARDERITEEENSLLTAMQELTRNEESRLLELTEEEFINKTNAQDVLANHNFEEIKKKAFKELQKYGIHRDSEVRFGKGRYLVVGDSHGKHTKRGMFDLLGVLRDELAIDGTIHVGHMLDDDGDMSYLWDEVENLTVIPKLDEVYHLETVKSAKSYKFDMVRSEVKVGNFSILNQDIIGDYVKAPLTRLDQQIFPDNIIVNSHRHEMISRTTYADNDVMAYSAGSLCERHIVKTIKQIDFADGYTVKKTKPEGYAKYRRMRHLYEFWQQGMVLVEFDGSHTTVTPLRVHNIEGTYTTSYYDKIYEDNGNVVEPENKIFLNGDAHVPSHDPDVLQVQEDVALNYKPDMYVNVGDFLDGESLNHHAMDRGIPITSSTLDECAHAHYILKRMSNWAPVCHIIHGNHERFYKDFTSKFPQLNSLLNFKFLSALDDLGYSSTDVKDTIEIGTLTVIHGDLVFFGQTGTKMEKASKTFGGDVIIGHVHSPTSRYNCHAMGLTGQKDQGYNEINASNWVHGFALVNQYKGFNFIQNHTIHDNTIVLDGQRFESFGSENWEMPDYTASISFNLD
jgi:predicted phosphodiesterase